MSPPDAPFVTVVAGVPRSGTSLMMQMLRAGGLELLTDGARPADADNPNGYFEFAAVRGLRRDAAWLDGAEGSAVKIVHSLVTALPADRAYRVILLRRRLAEVAVSQRAMLERAGAPPDDLADERVTAVFRAQLDEVDRWLTARRNFSLLRVDYNDAVSHPGPVAERVNRFLGGNLDCDAMAAAVDPALYRQRR